MEAKIAPEERQLEQPSKSHTGIIVESDSMDNANDNDNTNTNAAHSRWRWRWVLSCCLHFESSTYRAAWMRHYQRMQIASAGDVFTLFKNLKGDIDALVFDEHAMVQIFSSIIKLQNGNKAFNEKLGQLGTCELIVFVLQSINNKTKQNHENNQYVCEIVTAKILEVVRFICAPGLSREAQIKQNIAKIGKCGKTDIFIAPSRLSQELIR